MDQVSVGSLDFASKKKRAFAGLELGRDAIPDETTMLNFRHLLERQDLTKAIFEWVAERFAMRGQLLRGGTIVDATLIAALTIRRSAIVGTQAPGLSQRQLLQGGIQGSGAAA